MEIWSLSWTQRPGFKKYFFVNKSVKYHFVNIMAGGNFTRDWFVIWFTLKQISQNCSEIQKLEKFNIRFESEDEI